MPTFGVSMTNSVSVAHEKEELFIDDIFYMHYDSM